MAKGRSTKGKAPSDGKVKDGSKKVSGDGVDPASGVAGGEQGKEIWDLVHVIGKGETVTCRTEGCGAAAVATWATNVNPDDKWPLCEACQEEDFGGWPEDHHEDRSVVADDEAAAAPPPMEVTQEATDGKESPHGGQVDTSMDPDDKHTTKTSEGVSKEDSEEIHHTTEATVTQSAHSEDDGEDGASSSPNKTQGTVDTKVQGQEDVDESESVDGGEEEEGDIWDLTKILSHAEVTRECPIKCSTPECRLVACCIFMSNKSKKWYSCIDCQENDFGGWPPVEELPVKALSPDHIQALITKCSKKKSPAMPALPESLSPMKQRSRGNASNTVTPPPNSLAVGQASSKGGSKPTITPTPGRPAKPSATLLKRHTEWQQAAEKHGGPGARIVVKKAEAKKLVFDLLYDAFRPMNITQIYTELKAVVPSPILKSCLDEMAMDKQGNPFDESDDEDDKPKSEKKEERSDEPFAGSLSFKPGRNSNTFLYFVDYTKLQNNGDGLDPDQRNILASDLATARAEESALTLSLKSSTAETAKLLSEPTNEEATAALEIQEAEMSDLRDKLEVARKLKGNEKHKKTLKKHIDSMVAQWRKRKRLCMDFLIQMEESTEGTVSMKKCLAGDGQIDVESDESAINGALAYAKKKRSRGPAAKKMRVAKGLAGSSKVQASKSVAGGLTADEAFVAVKLDAMGKVCRVYLDDDE